MSSIRARAESFCHSYAKAMSLGTSPKATTADIAEALFSHYRPTDFTAFSMGQRIVMGDATSEVPKMEKYLQQWLSHGIGLDIRMERHRVDVVSDLGETGGGGSAMCWITWRVYPASPEGAGRSIEGWEWENMYAFRLAPGQEKGVWEFVVSDNEVAGLLGRFPGWFDGLR